MRQVTTEVSGFTWRVCVDGVEHSRHAGRSEAEAIASAIRSGASVPVAAPAEQAEPEPAQQLPDGTAKDVAAAILAGEWDAVLGELESSDPRKTVQAAVAKRRESLA